MNDPADAVLLVSVGRPGVGVREYKARCGVCRGALSRLASFRVIAVDYIACSLCGRVNVVRRPRV